MKLLGELAKGAFQLLFIGAFADAQDFIIVAFGHADPSAQLFLTQVPPSRETEPSPRDGRGENGKALRPVRGHSRQADFLESSSLTSVKSASTTSSAPLWPPEVSALAPGEPSPACWLCALSSRSPSFMDPCPRAFGFFL